MSDIYDDANNAPLALVLRRSGRDVYDWLIEALGGENPRTKSTPVGGRAIILKNTSGSASVKGRLVSAQGASEDFAYSAAAGDGYQPIGVELDDGVPSGCEGWVVVSGAADVLLKDATASTRGYWVKLSDTLGRADATNAFPPGGTIQALEDHGREIGHCIESVIAGTNKTARVVLHFN